MKTNETLSLPPIIKQIEVSCPPARAFELFTREIHAWWPLTTHSLAGADHDHCEIEPRVGGRVFERDRSGRVIPWGTVLEWTPPACLRFTWRVGKAANSSQEVEVRFEASPNGTRVTLTHGGWEVPAYRENYDSGWDHVLGQYMKHAAS